MGERQMSTVRKLKSSFELNVTTMRGKDTPRFKHDCNRCTFLGVQGPFDVYICTGFDKHGYPQRDLDKTDVILRESDEPSDNRSANMAALLHAKLGYGIRKHHPEPHYAAILDRMLEAGIVDYKYESVRLTWAHDYTGHQI